MVIVIGSMRETAFWIKPARWRSRPIDWILKNRQKSEENNGAKRTQCESKPKKIKTHRERNGHDIRALNTVGHNFIEMKLLMS